jgi:hypothetical protein
MLKTNFVDLEALGILLASDRLGIVVGQLCVDLTAHEPYRCKPELVDAQLEAIAVFALLRYDAAGESPVPVQVRPPAPAFSTRVSTLTPNCYRRSLWLHHHLA